MSSGIGLGAPRGDAHWDNEFDVVVVGSGAGGLTAAIVAHDLGQSVVVIEKSDQYGGTSAISGGGVWVPCNHLLDAAGAADSHDDALTYLKAATRGDGLRGALARLSRARAADGPLSRREDLSSLPRDAQIFRLLPRAAAAPSRVIARWIRSPFNAALLGDEFARMRPPQPGTLIAGRVTMTAGEAHVILCKERGWIALFMRRMARYWLDLPWRFRSKRDRRLTLGSSMVGSLRRSMMDRNIPLWLNTSLDSLVTDARRVVGITATQNGKHDSHRGEDAALSSLPAASSTIRRCATNTCPSRRAPNGPSRRPSNTGDAIRAGQGVGAQVAPDGSCVVGADGFHHGPREAARAVRRAQPARMRDGQSARQVASWTRLRLTARSFTRCTPIIKKSNANMPAWLVFDADFRRKYPCGPLLPGMVRPDKSLPAGWAGTVYFKGDTLDSLAAQIDVDAKGLRETVARMNEYAASGDDKEFGKGSNNFDRYYGDVNVKPNPCLAPIAKPPFYAMRIDAGDIGTKGGLLTDEYARVLRDDGNPIPGLYATGNTSAAVMGPSYPGAGSTLGPAMTFGYIAAHHLAGV